MTNPNGYGLTAEQAANEERHQRSLDRFFGPETREPRFPSRQPLPAFEAIEGRIRMIPGMSRHLEGIDLDGDGVVDIPLGPPPMDPMGRMQWQAMAEHRQRAMRHVADSRQRRKEQGNVAMLRMLASLDRAHGIKPVTPWIMAATVAAKRTGQTGAPRGDGIAKRQGRPLRRMATTKATTEALLPQNIEKDRLLTP